MHNLILEKGAQPSQSTRTRVPLKDRLDDIRDARHILNNQHWEQEEVSNHAKGGASVAPSHLGWGRVPSGARSGRRNSLQM
jgi:hypothetical protein